MHSKNQKEIVFSSHSLARMFERGIPFEYVRQTIKTGNIIEKYPDDRPYPSVLLVCNIEGVYLHVVKAESEEADIVITAYYPDPELWDVHCDRRKKE